MFAVSGALAAGRKRLDLIGVMVLAVVTAIGGGTVRDVLLDRHPIFWIADPTYVTVILGAAGATLLLGRRVHRAERILLVADALGLALFAIAGAQVAEALGHVGLVVVLMGTITGAAGGVVRDVLTAEIPHVMRKGSLYASTAILGIVVYLLLEEAGVARDIASVAGMVVVAGTRLGALAWGWHLPEFGVDDSAA